MRFSFLCTLRMSKISPKNRGKKSEISTSFWATSSQKTRMNNVKQIWAVLYCWGFWKQSQRDRASWLTAWKTWLAFFASSNNFIIQWRSWVTAFFFKSIFLFFWSSTTASKTVTISRAHAHPAHDVRSNQNVSRRSWSFHRDKSPIPRSYTNASLVLFF